MNRRYRHRRRAYAVARPSAAQSVVRGGIMILLGLLLIWGAGRLIWGLFTGSSVLRAPVELQVEQGGTVNVALGGGLLQRAEGALSLYEDDRVATGTTGHAQLKFFDDSIVRLDKETEVKVVQSNQSEDDASDAGWELSVTSGGVWLHVPTSVAPTSRRAISTVFYDTSIPADTELYLTSGTLMVFRANGAGVAVSTSETDDPVYIGEGQQTSFDGAGESEQAIYDQRQALDPTASKQAFIVTSRNVALGEQGTGAGDTESDDGSILSVSAPSEGATINGSTVTVRGKVDTSVNRVRINGYATDIQDTSRTFEQQLALEEDTLSIVIEALDASGVVLDRITRTVTRGETQNIGAPTITAPAGNGQTFRTDETEIEIRGTAPAGTQGIVVNDYRLQLFRPGDTTWSYLASTALGNLRVGTTVYSITAIDENGTPSTPATLTVVLGSDTQTSSTSSVPGSTNLPDNEPLNPGILRVTGPEEGGSYTSTGTGFLLEGTTSADTASIWINDYRLQLFESGDTYWNYIAREDYGNLSEGVNVYLIIARDAQNRILDRLQYTVTHQ